MANTSMIEPIGIANAIMPDAVLTLRAALRGRAFVKGDSEYDEARSIWNGMVIGRRA